jgi:integrase
MAGYIRQRGKNSWQLTVYIGWDNEARKRRYANKTVTGTKRDAERALAKFVTEVTDGARVATAPISVEDVLTRWLAARKAQLAPSTADRYRVAIKLVPDSIKRMGVAKLRAHHIEDLYADLVAAGQSGSSIRKLHWAMRQSMEWAHKRGYTGLIATNGVDLPPLGAKKLSPPESENLRRVIDHLLATNPDWGTLVALVAWTGCRRGEVCGLRWEDVDLRGKSVLIHRSVVAVPGGVEERGTKTCEQRRIAIGPKTVKLLREHEARCKDRAKKCNASLEPSAFVFSPDAAGRKPYNPHTITRTFIAACEDAGVPRMRLHDLRHHSATTLLKNGAAVGEVMDRHGWKTIEMVNRYRHLLEAKDVEAARALEDA